MIIMEKDSRIQSHQRRFHLGLITVEPVLFLYMFASFLYYPTMQSLIFDKLCFRTFNESFCRLLKSNSTFKDDHDSQYHTVNSETSHWILYTTVALTAPSFLIVILLLGAVGDRIDRKIPVILQCIGALFSHVAALLNAYYMSASIFYVLIGPILNGIFGGYIACLMSVYSYIGHISSTQSKMMRVGILEAMIFIAGTIGVFVSGAMLDNKGYVFVFSVNSIAITIAILYSFLWLKSLRPSDVSQGGNCCNWIATFFKESFRCVAKRRPGHTVLAIAFQVIALDILMLCTSGDMDVSLLYLRESLDYSLSLYGYYKGFDNFLRGVILITVLPLVKKFFNLKNLPLVLVGLVSFAANYVILGIATAKWIPFIASAVGMLKGVPSAGLRATMSSMVSSDEQGRLFGLIAASESLITVVASLLFNELYPATYKIYHGLVYLLATGLVVIAFFLILYLVYIAVEGRRGDQQYKPFLEEEEDDHQNYSSVRDVQNADLA